MEKGPRKATEVLLDMESKIDILLNIVRTQDLNIKILTNKLNAISEKLEKTSLTPPAIRIEAVDTAPIPVENKQIQISPENPITMEKEPKGFRRTSRPETYAGDDVYRKSPSTNQAAPVPAKYPMQLPKQFEPEVVVPQQALKPLEVKTEKSVKEEVKESSSNNISVIQRIVDKNGKSVFLADVEVMTLEDKQTVVKTRTNGAGKWMASLPMGEYKVFIRKKEAINKDKMEVIQEIRVDGTKSQVELPTAIIKT